MEKPSSLNPCPACGKPYYAMADKCPNCFTPNTGNAYQVWKVCHQKVEQEKERKRNSVFNKIGFIFGGGHGS